MSWQATKAVMEHSRAKGAARLVLCVLAYHADAKGQCAPSPGIDLICREANLSERGARYALRELEEDGEIVTQVGRGKGNLSSFEICLPIDGEVKAKGAQIAPFAREEKGQSLPDNDPEKGQNTTPKGAKYDAKRGKIQQQKGQNTAAKGANCAAHIGRTVMNRHEPSEPAERTRATEPEAPLTANSPRRENVGEVPFSSVSPDAPLSAIEAMTDAVFRQYAISGKVDGRFERQIVEQVGRLNNLGCTTGRLAAFFEQRTRLPSLNHLVTDWQTWNANEQRAAQAGGRNGAANGTQRPRETHNGRNARLTLELLGITPQLAGQDSGVPDPDDEPATRLALVERGGRRA